MYNVIDASAPKTQTQYRLIENDLDGLRRLLGTASVEAMGSQSDIGITIHPNPATDIFTLQLGDHSDPATIAIFNELGVEILKEVGVVSDEIEIDASHFSAGVYYVEVIRGERTQRTKLVIAK